MADKKNEWGGPRPKQRDDDQRGGPRPGSGPKQVRFHFGSIGDNYVIERSRVDGVPGPPEMWEVVLVTDDYFELQRTVDGISEIMTVSKLDFWNGDR